MSSGAYDGCQEFAQTHVLAGMAGCSRAFDFWRAELKPKSPRDFFRSALQSALPNPTTAQVLGNLHGSIPVLLK
jgi:hypothetical protein